MTKSWHPFRRSRLGGTSPLLHRNPTPQDLPSMPQFDPWQTVTLAGLDFRSPRPASCRHIRLPMPTKHVRPRACLHTSGELMFDHVVFGVSDYAASKAFFLKALEPLGVAVVLEGPLGVELSPKGKSSLCMFQTEEKPAHLHLAFTAENRQQVEAFYRAALEAGGKRQWCAWSAPALPRELLCCFRHWSGRAQHRSGLPRTRGLTIPSRGRPQDSCAHPLRTPDRT